MNTGLRLWYKLRVFGEHHDWKILAVLFLLLPGVMAISASPQTNSNLPVIAPPQNVPVKKVSKDFSDIVKKFFPKGKMVHVAVSPPRAMDEGMRYVSITVMDGKQEFVMMFYGVTMVDITKVLAPGDCPAAVTNAVVSRYPGMTINSVEEIIADGRHPMLSPPKALGYQLHIVTEKKEKLFIWVEPEFITNAKGEEEPTGKLRIDGFTESDGNFPDQ